MATSNIDAEDGVYPPREDSFLMEEVVAQNISSSIETLVEVGVGSGYVLLNIKGKYPRITAIGTDLNIAAVSQAHRNAKKLGLDVLLVAAKGASCFRIVPDVYVFNPPYLPSDDDIDPYLSAEDRLALVGGKVGTEVLCEFVETMEQGSKGYFIISSLATTPERFGETVAPDLVTVKGKIQLAHEVLWVIELKKT